MSRLLTVSLALVGGLAGCAGTPPTKNMERASAAIGAAEEMGAARVPAATLHLQLAKEQSEYAKTLIKNGQTDEARRVLMRAESDADVAIALTRADTEMQRAAAAQQRLDQLKSANK